MLKRAVAALDAGGMIMVQEFILNNEHDGPLHPTLFSMNMLLGTPKGQAYSENEICEMLKNAGAVDIRRLPIELPNGAGIIVGIVRK